MGLGMQSGLHVPTHTKSKTHMGYITHHLEHDIVCFPICSWLINFYTIGNNDNNTYMSQMTQLVQEQLCRTVGPSLAASLEPMAHIVKM